MCKWRMLRCVNGAGAGAEGDGCWDTHHCYGCVVGHQHLPQACGGTPTCTTAVWWDTPIPLPGLAWALGAAASRSWGRLPAASIGEALLPPHGLSQKCRPSAKGRPPLPSGSHRAAFPAPHKLCSRRPRPRRASEARGFPWLASRAACGGAPYNAPRGVALP